MKKCMIYSYRHRYCSRNLDSLDSIGSICIKAVASTIKHPGFSIHASLRSDMLFS